MIYCVLGISLGNRKQISPEYVLKKERKRKKKKNVLV